MERRNPPRPIHDLSRQLLGTRVATEVPARWPPPQSRRPRGCLRCSLLSDGVFGSHNERKVATARITDIDANRNQAKSGVNRRTGVDQKARPER